ncbi:MAG: hypothetical protein U1F57_12370 [bacterium]
MGKKTFTRFGFPFFLILALFCETASARSPRPPESKPSTATAECPQSAPASLEKNAEIPPGLDFKTRRAQRRLIEFEPFGGEYLGNYLNNSFVVGARLAFRITEAISIGAEFNYSNAQFRSHRQSADPSPLGKSSSRMPSSMRHPSSKAKGHSRSDLFTTVGIGDIHINGKDRVVGVLGGGLKLFFKPSWLALRFDINTYMYSLPRLNDSKFADDWSFTLGPSFLFVPKKPKI